MRYHGREPTNQIRPPCDEGTGKSGQSTGHDEGTNCKVSYCRVAWVSGEYYIHTHGEITDGKH